MSNCDAGVQGCTLTSGTCTHTSGTGRCYGLTQTYCKAHATDWGCKWNLPYCSGSICKYQNGTALDPGFYSCSGYPSVVTGYTCDPNNVYVYIKLTDDGVATTGEPISCPSGQRCDMNSSTHCSATRICTPGMKRCPLATGREYNYFEQCSSDGFRWNSVNCPSGQWCDSSSSTFCKSAQICSPNTRRCSSTSREIQKCNSAGTAWETIQSCYPEGTCRLTAYGPACS
jgi:hypothetical protein